MELIKKCPADKRYEIFHLRRALAGTPPNVCRLGPCSAEKQVAYFILIALEIYTDLYVVM